MNPFVSCRDPHLVLDTDQDHHNARVLGIQNAAMVAGGYAYVLLDIFNSSPINEAKKITIDHFKKIKMDELLTMNRKTGFYEMIEMMMKRIKNVRN